MKEELPIEDLFEIEIQKRRNARGKWGTLRNLGRHFIFGPDKRGRILMDLELQAISRDARNIKPDRLGEFVYQMEQARHEANDPASVDKGEDRITAMKIVWGEEQFRLYSKYESAVAAQTLYHVQHPEMDKIIMELEARHRAINIQAEAQRLFELGENRRNIELEMREASGFVYGAYRAEANSPHRECDVADYFSGERTVKWITGPLKSELKADKRDLGFEPVSLSIVYNDLPGAARAAAESNLGIEEIQMLQAPHWSMDLKFKDGGVNYYRVWAKGRSVLSNLLKSHGELRSDSGLAGAVHMNSRSLIIEGGENPLLRLMRMKSVYGVEPGLDEWMDREYIHDDSNGLFLLKTSQLRDDVPESLNQSEVADFFRWSLGSVPVPPGLQS